MQQLYDVEQKGLKESIRKYIESKYRIYNGSRHKETSLIRGISWSLQESSIAASFLR